MSDESVLAGMVNQVVSLLVIRHLAERVLGHDLVSVWVWVTVGGSWLGHGQLALEWTDAWRESEQ